MIFLLLAILFNVAIFGLFRIFDRYRINRFQAIVVNYIVCVVTGIAFVGGLAPFQGVSVQTIWLPFCFVLGFIFIGTFYSMALTTQKFSITVSSVASKISLAIPVLFTLFVFKFGSKIFDFWNYFGLVLSVVAIILTSTSSVGKAAGTRLQKGKLLLLPLAVFVLGGILDTMFTYINHEYLTEQDEAIFPVFIFLTAATTGIVIMIIQRTSVSMATIVGGVLLGAVNYFSVYFILRTLTAYSNDGAIVFPLLNMGIIIGSMLLSIGLFSEKMNSKKWAGIGVALVAIFLISYQELL